MIEIRKTVRLFGDDTEVIISVRGADVVGLRPVRGKDEIMKIVEAVGKQLESGKKLSELYHKATVLQELVFDLYAELNERAQLK